MQVNVMFENIIFDPIISMPLVAGIGAIMSGLIIMYYFIGGFSLTLSRFKKSAGSTK